MNLLIDFTSSAQQQLMISMSQLQTMEDINQITFIVPVFLFFQNNFKLLINYMTYLTQRPLTKTQIQPVVTQEEIKQLEQYNVVLVRGTFDHLHLGHQVLLMKAIYSASHKLIIQIKDDTIMNNKQYKQLIQPVQVRKENIKKFIQHMKPQLQVKIQIITEVYGSAPYTKGIDAVAISQQSIHSLNHINKLRKSNNGLKKVQMIISPLMTVVNESSIGYRQQRIQGKLSSFRIREYILKENNFTLSEYLGYRARWDSLVKEVNSLCRVKDVDEVVVERWWQRVVQRHTRSSFSNNNRTFTSNNNTANHTNVSNLTISTKKLKKTNKQIYEEIIKHSKASPLGSEQSLKQIGVSLGLLMDGVEQEEKNVNAVVRVFLQNLLKKKGRTKTCKKIRKMLMNYIKQFVQLKTGGKKKESVAAAVGNDSVIKGEEQKLQATVTPTIQIINQNKPSNTTTTVNKTMNKTVTHNQSGNNTNQTKQL